MAGRFYSVSRAALVKLLWWVIDGFWIRVGDEVYFCNPSFAPMIDVPGISHDGTTGVDAEIRR
jgi:hypothetical protein